MLFGSLGSQLVLLRKYANLGMSMADQVCPVQYSFPECGVSKRSVQSGVSVHCMTTVQATVISDVGLP